MCRCCIRRHWNWKSKGWRILSAGNSGWRTGSPDLSSWKEMVERLQHPSVRVTIALVGKYVELHDAYLSVAEALKHGGIPSGAEVNILWVDSEQVTPETAESLLGGADGILIPGGFGSRGVDGKIAAVQYAREHKVPFLGICLGMQVAVIE